MKGNKDVIDTLNKRLSEELTAINQYMVHSEMCANWGYERLHESIEKQAVDEMHHAEWLIARIIFLEGQPVVSKLNPIHIGKDVPSMVANDLEGEKDAVRSYSEAILQCEKVADIGTRDLLTKILRDEERHTDWEEAQQDQMSQMGLQNYLAQQTADGE
jgi:bacterioferritin